MHILQLLSFQWTFSVNMLYTFDTSYLFHQAGTVIYLQFLSYQIIYKARMISQGVFFSLLDRFLSVLEACSMFDLWLCVVKYSK